MCGIFGIATSENTKIAPLTLTKSIGDLFILSESRGREASGFALRDANAIRVLKEPRAASVLLKQSKYNRLVGEWSGKNGSQIFIGHARLVTNGSMEENENNQPVVKAGLVGVHNGIVVNDSTLWRQFPELKREKEVDTEIFLALLKKFINGGQSIAEATAKTFATIEGEASVAVLFNDRPALLLATNTGSIYYIQSPDQKFFIFASEQYILKVLIQKNPSLGLDQSTIRQLAPFSGKLIDLDESAFQDFSFGQETSLKTSVRSGKPVRIEDLSPKLAPRVLTKTGASDLGQYEREFETKSPAIAGQRRCTRCILPMTMPFIEFDVEGVCNYCRHYRKMEVLGPDALPARFANSDSSQCLVTFSGGRDSSYALHYIKRVLGITPIAYCYDWGMLTDLGRRNQARMCGKLGVEHIIVSADIAKKRANIRKNVLAWLHKPDLGTVPIFMAGDKQFFYYANKLSRQTGTSLILFAENPLEKTYFKSGFCGLRPDFQSANIHALNLYNKFKLARYYAREYITNPAYLNSSLIDTLGAYASYYFIPHNYLYFFNYIKWDESEVERTLLDEYNWEKASDTKTTWRIGDGTAAFYNYIYHLTAGFTENDTFRSNQIREGVLSRDEALRLAERDNRPRFESMRWYTDTIGIDLAQALSVIGRMPKLYE